MIKEIITNIINKALGNYVENFDSSQFSLGLGDIVFNNLELKHNCLDELDIPFKLSFGKIGKLSIKVSYLKFFSSPCVVIIDELYVLAVPNQSAKYNADLEKRAAKQAKEAELLRVEEAKKREYDRAHGIKKPPMDRTFIEKIASTFIKNLEVIIKNIHLRFEDSISNPGKTFSFGVTLSSLEVKTVPSWDNKLHAESIPFLIFKQLSINWFCIYWNSQDHFFLRPLTPTQKREIGKNFLKGIRSKANIPQSHKNLLGPMNARSNLRINLRPELDGSNFTIPKFSLSFVLEELLININKIQFQEVVMFLETLNLMKVAAEFRKYKPDILNYEKNFKAWWRFAYACVAADIKRRKQDWSWEHMKKHRKIFRDYRAAYLSKLKSPNKSVDSLCKKYEDQLNVFNIVLARQIAEREFSKKAATPPVAEKKGFGRWFGFGGDSSTTSTVSVEPITLDNALTPEEKAEMYKAIGYTEGEMPANYPDFFVEFDLAATIHKIEIKFVDDKNIDIMTILLKELMAGVRQRPAIKSVLINFSIEQFRITGLAQNKTIPVLLSKKSTSKDKDPLIEVLFETNPLGKKDIDQKIVVTAEPILIVYDALTINNLIELFKVKENTVSSKIQAAAQAKLQEFKQVSALGLQNMLEKHLNLDLSVNIRASSVLVPQKGFFVENCPVLAATLGNIKITTIPRKEFLAKEAMQEQHDPNSIEYLMKYGYDNFQCDLTDIQVVFATAVEKWNHPIEDMYFLKPTTLKIDIGTCVTTNDLRLPQLRVHGQLVSINISIGELRLRDCLALLLSIPLPGSLTQPQFQPKIEEVHVTQSVHSIGVRASQIRLSQYDKPSSLLKEEDRIGSVISQQAYQIDAKFELKEVLVSISVQKDGKIEELMQFQLRNLETTFSQYTFVMKVGVKLGSIRLMHHFNKDWLNVISTSKIVDEDYLFAVKYKNVNKDTPDFHTKYKSTLQLIEVDFTKLEVMLHCEALLALLVWADDFSKSFELQEGIKQSIELHKNISKRPTSLGTSLIDFRGSTTRLSSNLGKFRRSYKVDEIKIKVKACLGEIAVSLWRKKSQLASLGMTGGECVLAVKASYTKVDLKLRGIYIINHDLGTLYRNILQTSEETEVLSLQFVKFENVERKRDSVDMSVTLNMSAIKFVFINKFIMSILNFVNHFSAARDAIIDASSAAAEAAKLNVQSAIQNALKVALIIDLEAPKIIIPVSDRKQKAFILDLGQLTANNTFLDVKVPNSDENAVLDRLHLDLHNLQMNQVLLDTDTGKTMRTHAVIQPISFILTIQRNLSSGWFLDVPDIEIGGKLQSIKVSFNKTDYLVMTQLLEENIGDPSITSEVPKTSVKTVQEVRKSSMYFDDSMYKESVSKTVGLQQTIVRSNMKFALTLESLILELSNVEPENPDHEEKLSCISLELVSVKGSMMSDDSMHFAVALLDFIMDDTRPTKDRKISRYMQRKKSPDKEQEIKSMIDVTYQQKPSFKFVDVRISSIDLILNIEFMTEVSNFFSTLADAPLATVEDIKIPIKTYDGAKKKVEDVPVDTGRISVNFKVEHPDIVLVENIDDPETNALVLDFELTVTANMGNDKSLFSGSLSDLQLFTCCYNPSRRGDTKAPVLNPVSFLLSGCGEKGNLKVEIDTTRIKVSVTPGVVVLLSKVVSSLTSGVKPVDEDTVSENIDRAHLWAISGFYDSDYSFLSAGAEVGEDALMESRATIQKKLPSRVEGKKIEIFIFKISQITISFEAGFGKATMPLLFADAGFELTALDWSTKLHLDGKLHLEVNYFNNSHAMWEPVLEPVGRTADNLTTDYSPWTITVRLDTCDDGDLQEQPTHEGQSAKNMGGTALTQITVQSEDILNFTISKTALEVLFGLGDLLSSAIYTPEDYEGEKAPYVVKNECGITVKILLDREFKVYSRDETEHVEVEFVVLDHDSYVGLKSNTEIEYLGLSEETKEKFIHILIPEYRCDFQIPLLKASKRFFPLKHRRKGNDQWGIVTEVVISNGQTSLTLRGIIQVNNLYNIPINIYSMTDKQNELHLIGTVTPNETINIPLESIYTQTTELFFSADGYTVSIVPYVWKDLQQCITKSKILKCNPKYKGHTEPLFLRVDGELEQIFFENTSRHTMLSTCFKLKIRPTFKFKNILPVDVVVLIQGIPGETLVQPAVTIQLPTAEPGTSFIVIRIPNYLDREWSCKHELEENPQELTIWTFDSFESSKHVLMDLGMHMELRQGTHEYTLYCPFWMINKTGIPLVYKRSSKPDKESSSPEHSDDQSSLYHPEDFDGIILFSFRAKSFFIKKKSSIRVYNGPWSEKFSLDAVGSSGVVVCKHGDMVYYIGVKIQLSNNALTKEIIFTPFYVFINNFRMHSIDVREIIDNRASTWRTVPPENCVPFWPNGKPESSKLEARITDTKESTILFPFNKSHHSVLKLNNKFGAVDVDVEVSDGGVYISFYPYEVGMAPVLIINHTDHEVDFCDKSTRGKCSYLKSREKVLFTWDKVEENHVLSFCNGAFTTDLKEDSMGRFVVKNNIQLYSSSFLYGPQRVFLITESQAIAAESINLTDYEIISQEIALKLRGLGLSLIDNKMKSEVLYLSLSSSEVVWETRKNNKKAFKKMSPGDSAALEQAYQDYHSSIGYGINTSPVIKINNRISVDFKSMKMLQPSDKEIRRSYMDGLWISLKFSAHLSRIHLKINSFQIDQQVYDCVFPVMFAPVPPPKSVMQSSKPFIEVSILKMANQFSHLEQFKYIGILIQEFHVRADSGLLTNVLNFIESAPVSEEIQINQMKAELERVKQPLYLFMSQSSMKEQKNYYSKLHLSPLKIHVSFSLSSGTDSGDDDRSLMPPIVALFLQSFGVTLTDVDDVIFKIKCFERDVLYVSQTQLVKEVQSHYVNQILQQLYVVILGLDVIGNPFGLISGLKTGATDLFYEPFQGAIRGPGEFAEGLVLGVRSLFGHTVGGAAGAVSKMTGALGKGLAALTFDDEYQRHRRELQRSKPHTVQEGFARSGKGLVMGVIEGVGGVVTKPISGAKEEGVQGFFKGFGKGMVGLITRPTAGIVDFASGSLGAVRRAAEVSTELPRKRFPRYIRPDGFIKPYCPHEAEGNKFLQELEKGKYSKTDEYIFHMPIGYAEKFKDVLLLTDHRMIYVAYNEIFGGYQLEWIHQWEEITKDPEAVEDGIKFWVSKKASLKTLFTTPDTGKILFIEKYPIREYVLQVIKEMRAKTIGASNQEGELYPTVKLGEVLRCLSWTFLIAFFIVRGESHPLNLWLDRFSYKRKCYRN